VVSRPVIGRARPVRVPKQSIRLSHFLASRLVKRTQTPYSGRDQPAGDTDNISAGLMIMNKTEIAAALRQEVGEIEVAIKKLQTRCEKLKKFVLDLEAEIEGEKVRQPSPLEKGKFREVVDRVFGEKPKRKKA